MDSVVTKKARTKFQSSLGEFTAVANANKIQAIADERDAAKAQVVVLTDLVKQLPHLVDGEGEGLPWWSRYGEKPTGFHVPMDYVREAPCETPFYHAIDDALEDKFVLNQVDCPHPNLRRSSDAWEVLAGGVWVDVSHIQDLEEAKAIARLVVGEEKAAIAEGLTDADKAEFKIFMKGLRMGLSMASMAADAKTKDDDRMDHYEEKLCAKGNWVRESAAKFKDQFPPKLYALFCEPDARAWLVFPFARELYAHFGGDYDRTVKTLQDAFHRCWDASQGGDYTFGAKLDDTKKSIKKRVKLVEDGAREDAERDAAARARWAEECAERRARHAANPELYRRPESEFARKRRLGKEGRVAIRKEAAGGA